MEDLISKALLDHIALDKIISWYKVQEVLTWQGMLFAVVFTEQ